MTAPPAAVFTVADYIVLGATFFISAMIGIYFVVTGRKDQSRENYFLGNRKMGIVPVSLSYLATGISAVSFIGIPAEVYYFGASMVFLIPARILATLVAARSAIPIYYRIKVTSIYEYLEMRFDRSVKIAGMVVFYLFFVCYMGLVVYAPALALSLITGMSEVSSILIVTIVCSFYTTIGGMKAVIWTDVFQAFLMTTGLLAIVIGALVEINGFSEMAERVAAGGRSPYLDFRPDITVRYTVYSLFCNGFFSAFSFIVTGQPIVQRCLSCSSLQQAQRVVIIGFCLAACVITMAILSGLSAYAYYADCDPLTTGRMYRIDQIVPLIIGDLFSRYPGFSGLIVSGAFSASLSTISSSLNSMAAVFEAAVLRRVIKDASDRQLTFWSKIVTIVSGIVCTLVSLLATKLSGVVEETVAFSSIMISPLAAVFFLGFFVPRCNSKGAICGMVTGVAFGFWIKICSEVYPLPGPSPVLSVEGCPWNEVLANVTSYAPYTDSTFAPYTEITALPSITDPQETSAMVVFYNMSVYFYGLFTFTLTVVVGVLVSFATGSVPVQDPRLQISLGEVFGCQTSGQSRDTYYTGVDSDEKNEKEEEIKKEEIIELQ